MGTLQNFKDMGLYNMDEEGNMAGKDIRDLKDGDGDQEDYWIIQNAMRIERIKRRIDAEDDKKKRAKSAGEMALMFMGINKIAYDLMLENPMTGYMNEIIFVRVLGVTDIAPEWKDASQCYLCEKWNKIKIEYFPDDVKMMKQSTEKLEQLHEVIKQFIDF